jgi:hypothetical protein
MTAMWRRKGCAGWLHHPGNTKSCVHTDCLTGGHHLHLLTLLAPASTYGGAQHLCYATLTGLRWQHVADAQRQDLQPLIMVMCSAGQQLALCRALLA